MHIDCACKDCTDRYIGCHSTCDKYKEYREKIDCRNNNIIEAKKKDKDILFAMAKHKTYYLRKKK